MTTLPQAAKDVSCAVIDAMAAVLLGKPKALRNALHRLNSSVERFSEQALAEVAMEPANG